MIEGQSILEANTRKTYPNPGLRKELSQELGFKVGSKNFVGVSREREKG